jgi:HEAT repeat protein
MRISTFSAFRYGCVKDICAQLRDARAIPALIEIAESAPDANARKYALGALGENIQASEALPTIAAGLADLDSGVRLYALIAMNAIHEPACTLPMEPHWTEDMIEPQIRQCLAWWNDGGGKQQFSRQR